MALTRGRWRGCCRRHSLRTCAWTVSRNQSEEINAICDYVVIMEDGMYTPRYNLTRYNVHIHVTL